MILNSAPLNSVAVNSAGTAHVVSEATAAIALDDSCVGYIVRPLADSIAISAVAGSNSRYHGVLSDELALYDLLNTVLRGAASDAITVDDTSTGYTRFLAEVVDALLISDIAESRIQAIGIIADSILISDEAKQYYAGFVSDALAISDTIDSRVTVIGALTDALNIEDIAVPYIRIYGTASDALAVDDEISSRARFIGALEDQFSFTAILHLPDGEYIAYVVNTKNLATTKFTNYPFNSFAALHGKYYGLTDAGLYELTGDTDAGASIEATLCTAFTNLGTSLRKNCPRAYIGYTTDGRLLLKTITSHAGQKIVRWYSLAARTADAYREARVQLARGVQSVYWQFELVNVDGADFTLDTMQMLPVILDRRIG